jgi:purine-binding chemotaxis protein CheW
MTSPDSKQEAQTTVQAGKYLTFVLDGRRYGVPIATVREINRVSEITPVPRTPEFVVGVMNLRGKAIPVVDLRMKLGVKSSKFTRETCIIVIDTPKGESGIIVDAVQEVIDFTQDQLELPPRLHHPGETGFVSGVGKLEDKIVILIDILLALSPENFARTSAPPPHSDAA